MSRPKSFELSAQIRAFLAQHSNTDPNDWYLVVRARVGMEILFRVIRASDSRHEVITQAFTCATAVNPILQAGLTPVYGDIRDTFSLDPETLPDPSFAAALVVQHTFGLIDQADSRALVDFSHDHKLVCIEDSAHCLGRMSQTRADFSVHSFGAEKMLPTQFGGAVWVNPNSSRPEVSRQVRSVLASLRPLPAHTSFVAHLYRQQNRVLNHVPPRISASLRRIGQATRLFLPPVSSAERNGTQPYMLYRPSRWMLQRIADQMGQLDAIEANARKVAAIYRHHLQGKVLLPTLKQPVEQPLVRFPFCLLDHHGHVHDDPVHTEHVFTMMAAHHMIPGRWYRPSLFPGVKDPALYHYDAHKTDNTRSLTAACLNLRTNIPPTRAEHIALEFAHMLENN